MEKQKLHQHESPILIKKNIDINEIVISSLLVKIIL